MKNKKKVLAIALAVCLVAILSFSTLAWFTDAEKVTNTFEIGSIDIELVEDFTKPTTMIPVVNVADPATDPNFVKKEANIKNIGENPAYVQVFVAVPKALNRAGAFHIMEGSSADWTDAYYAGETTIAGEAYDVYRYRYTQTMAVGAETPDVITGAYLDAKLDYDHTTYEFIMDGTTITGTDIRKEINVYVAAQAIQQEGFSNYTQALDSGFGTELPSFT